MSMMEATPATLAGRIEMVRKDRGLSQQAFAELAGVSERTLRSFESGDAPQIGFANLTKMLDAAGYMLTIERKTYPATRVSNTTTEYDEAINQIMDKLEASRRKRPHER